MLKSGRGLIPVRTLSLQLCARVRVTQDLNSSIVKNGFRRHGFTGFQRA
jgi:hypothetical protein